MNATELKSAFRNFVASGRDVDSVVVAMGFCDEPDNDPGRVYKVRSHRAEPDGWLNRHADGTYSVGDDGYGGPMYYRGSLANAEKRLFAWFVSEGAIEC